MLLKKFKKSEETITYKKFKIKKKSPLIDTIVDYFGKNLTKNQYPLRWSVTGISRNKIIVEANILNLNKIKVKK